MRRKGLSLADKVTILRILLIPVFVALLIYSGQHPFLRYGALIVFILAMFSDFFDGLVARIKKDKSAIGEVIDPLADKLLLVTGFITLYLLKFRVPLWVVIVVVSRDCMILLGILMLSFMKIEVSITPSWSGKCATFFQMVTLFIALLERELFFASAIWIMTFSLTVISGTEYLLKGIRAINNAS